MKQSLHLFSQKDTNENIEISVQIGKIGKLDRLDISLATWLSKISFVHTLEKCVVIYFPARGC
jgi:hypothetical protein